MRCTSCGTDNSSDSRFCKHCGQPFPAAAVEQPAAVAVPGDRVLGAAADTVKSGPPEVEPDESPVLARPAVDAASVGTSEEPTVRGQPAAKRVAPAVAVEEERPSDPLRETSRQSPRALARGTKEPREPALDEAPGAAREPARPVLQPPTGQRPADGSMVASLSVHLSEVGVRSPRTLVLWAVVVAVVLFGLGAGAMYLGLRVRGGSTATVATGVPEEEPGLVIGMPVAQASAEADAPETDSTLAGRAGSAGRGTPAPPGGDAPASGGEGSASRPAGGAPASAPGPSGAGGRAPATSSGSAGAGEPAGGGGSDAPAAGSGSGSSASGGGRELEAPPPDDEMEERDPVASAYASQVRYVISHFYAARAQSCFERASRERSEPVYGTVVVRFVVGEDGNVQSATPVRNTTGSSELGDCLAGQVRSWRLPVPPGGSATMEMPFSQ